MSRTTAVALGTTLLVCLLMPAVRAEDYIRFRDGRIQTCAILRQDSAAIFTTEWDLRHLRLPPLQVYTRDEVQSIWFTTPEKVKGERLPYHPLPSQFEIGGTASFQFWSGSGLTRRGLMVFSAMGGYSIIREVGLELDADFTVPVGGESDTVWSDYGLGYQISLNVVGHPFEWKGVCPFFLAGGGAARDVPLGDVVLTNNNIDWSYLNFGAGIKWGSGGIGYRVEWRYGIYSFTPDTEIEPGIRTPTQDRSANSIRASLFLYF